MTTGTALREAFLAYRQELGPTLLVDADKRPLHKLNPLPPQDHILALLDRAAGVALRMWPESPVVCLDFDGPHARPAFDATGILLPETARTRTRSGGTHLFFCVAPGTPQPAADGTSNGARRAVRLVKADCDCTKDGKPHPCGVDLLLNGYAVVPPTPGYSEDPDHPLELARMAELPPAVVALARKSEQRDPHPPEPDARTGILDALRGPVPEGQRNDTAARLAGHLLPRHGNRVEDVTAFLTPWALHVCTPPMDLRELRATVQSVARREAGKSTAPDTLPTLDAPVAVLRGLTNQGDPMPTGLPILDQRLRGGMRPGKALVAGGTAGAGKTALAIQAAKAAGEVGCVVVCLLSDEGREPGIIRLGQQFGYERDALEAVDHPAHETALAGLERDLAGLDIFFPDPDGDGDVTLEGVVEALVQAYPDRQKLVVVDSIQTVRTRQTLRDVPSIRERVMGNARIARRLAVEHGLAMLYTSEVNRSWYRSRKEEDRASDLAAFAEARIEFSADVLLTMRAMDEDPDLVEVRIPKNRLGTRQGFLLRLDRTRARFEEVDGQAAEATRSAAETKRVDEALADMLRTLRDTPGLTSAQLQSVLAIQKSLFLLVMKKARQAGFVRLEKQGKYVLHYLAEVPK